LFHRFGGAIVFFARFVAVFRSLAALFAGAYRMDWLRFTIFNVAGAMAWSAVFGFGTYYFADEVKRWSGSVALTAGIVAGIAIIGGLIWTHGHEGELEERAKEKLESENRKQKPRTKRARSGA
jgi:membrane protein DedA with SNARE-associated domain